MLAVVLGVPSAAAQGRGHQRAAGGAGFRLIAPLSGSSVRTVRPAFRVEIPRGATGGMLDLCRDRACTTVVATIPIVSAVLVPGVDVPSGRIFWRARGADGSRSSATWELDVLPTGGTPGSRLAWGRRFDFNCDGFDDVYSPGQPSAGGRAGMPLMFLGAAGGLSSGVVVSAADRFAVAGDVNGDGCSDITMLDEVVGANEAGVTGTSLFAVRGVPAWSGQDIPTNLQSRWHADLSNPRVIPVGDVDADGIADVVVTGGNPRFISGTGWASLRSLEAAPWLDVADGAVVAGVGDVNGDGYDDIAAGTPAESRVAIFLGGPRGPAARPVVVAGPAGSSFGAAVAAGGDVNADGRGELLVGAPGVDSVFVYAGFPVSAGVAGAPIAQLRGTPGDHLGQALCDAADFDADGNLDVVAAGATQVLVFRGTSDGLAPTPTALALPAAVRGAQPIVLSVADTRNDGHPEIVVASGTGDVTYVFSGTTAGIAPQPFDIRIGEPTASP